MARAVFSGSSSSGGGGVRFVLTCGKIRVFLSTWATQPSGHVRGKENESPALVWLNM